MRETAPKRITTPEEEGIELLPDAMELLENAVKAAAPKKRPQTRSKRPALAQRGRRLRRLNRP